MYIHVHTVYKITQGHKQRAHTIGAYEYIQVRNRWPQKESKKALRREEKARRNKKRETGIEKDLSLYLSLSLSISRERG